ncbi:MAG: GntR family transcriptional regulator [Deltaproteobacteria bacterium]|jgi:DNA-binding GntR family transcriptional regulator|nr:GntR family transcriptional regulator [Deltaproteobacteria bacterium]
MNLKDLFSSTHTIDKENGKAPVYLQLSNIIKKLIAGGKFPHGTKLPSEAAIGRHYGLSTMTVRQALSLVAEQGLLRRVQGSGTFVTVPGWTRASFSWDGLVDLLTDRQNSSLKIIKAGIAEASPAVAQRLELEKNCKVIHLIRLVSHKENPFLLNETLLRFDPRAPVVEAELELSNLVGFFTGDGSNYIKKTALKVVPVALSQYEAERLMAQEGEVAFKIHYSFYDYDDKPLGLGWFLAAKKYVTLSTRIGLWDN